jgi:hypothetical protein
LRGRNRIGCLEQVLLGAIQFFDCGWERMHRTLREKSGTKIQDKNLERSSASLLESVGQLQDARLAESRAEKL